MRTNELEHDWTSPPTKGRGARFRLGDGPPVHRYGPLIRLNTPPNQPAREASND